MIFQKIAPNIYLAFFLACFEYGQGLNYVMINILELSQENSNDPESFSNNISFCLDNLFSFELTRTTTYVNELPTTVPYDRRSDASTTAEPPLNHLTTDPNTDQQTAGPPTLPPTASETASWGPFLESPGNFSGPQSHF